MERNLTTEEVEIVLYDNYDCKFVELICASSPVLKILKLTFNGDCSDYVMIDKSPLKIENLVFDPPTWEHT
jgi:hypothetical protein